MAGHSILVTGEAGSGKTPIARAVLGEMSDRFNCALADYKGSVKKCVTDIAQQLSIPTTEPKFNSDGEEVGEKPLTADGIKDAIAENISPRILLLIDNAHRWPASLRYWLEGLQAAGAVLVLFSLTNPRKDIYLRLLTIEIEPPNDYEIRQVMQAEAARLGLKISQSRLAALQSGAGRNLMLARKVIHQEVLGINQEPEHSQYIDISPIIMAVLGGFAVLRFIGMGTGNKALYIVGGVCLVLFMSLRSLGQLGRKERRLGK